MLDASTGMPLFARSTLADRLSPGRWPRLKCSSESRAGKPAALAWVSAPEAFLWTTSREGAAGKRSSRVRGPRRRPGLCAPGNYFPEMRCLHSCEWDPIRVVISLAKGDLFVTEHNTVGPVAARRVPQSGRPPPAGASGSDNAGPDAAEQPGIGLGLRLRFPEVRIPVGTGRFRY